MTEAGNMAQVWTVGHSNVPLAKLLETLAGASIALLVDIRRYPMSRRNPQFNGEALAASLADAGIEYRHAPELGGRRQPNADSFNLGLRDAGFRGFADYMWTPEFDSALTALIAQADTRRLAIMCAEAVPWRCHRSLIADALVARGVEVSHLIGATQRRHTLSPHARVQDGRVAYPALL
jgi:uncharacterized protein (DUF488 family)